MRTFKVNIKATVEYNVTVSADTKMEAWWDAEALFNSDTVGVMGLTIIDTDVKEQTDE